MNILITTLSPLAVLLVALSTQASYSTEFESQVPHQFSNSEHFSSHYNPNAPLKGSHTPTNESNECEEMIKKEIEDAERFLKSMDKTDDFQRIEMIPYENQLTDLKELQSTIHSTTTKEETGKKIREIIRRHFPQDDF